MEQTKKRHYDRYTLDFKQQAVKLANHHEVKAIHIAESLGIHAVMLYRWQMEYRNGELRANKHMKEKPNSAKRRIRTTSESRTEDELAKAQKKIKQLEKALAQSREDNDLLKKAQRFFKQETNRSQDNQYLSSFRNAT